MSCKPFLNTKAYYDELSAIYEKNRGNPYHQFIDNIQADVVLKYSKRRDKILDAGCGTGLIQNIIVKNHPYTTGIDFSEKMLFFAKQRGLNVMQGDITHLPFEDNTFDIVYSFKVLSHIQDIGKALRELHRILKVGGFMIVGYYNKNSLRFYRKKITQTLSKPFLTFSDSQVYTRHYNEAEFISLVPESLALIERRGAIVLSPAAFFLKFPVLCKILYKHEKNLSSSHLNKFSGFIILVFKKKA